MAIMMVRLTDALELGLQLRLVVAVGDIEVVIGIRALLMHKGWHGCSNGHHGGWPFRRQLPPALHTIAGGHINCCLIKNSKAPCSIVHYRTRISTRTCNRGLGLFSLLSLFCTLGPPKIPTELIQPAPRSQGPHHLLFIIDNEKPLTRGSPSDILTLQTF
jgi:hypothetical protein